MLSTLTVLAVASGILQALGYFVYIRQALSDKVTPNATTWLMFAYGTTLLTILEFDLDAGWYLLVLPVVCSICGIIMAVICHYRTRKWGMPEDRGDLIAFLTDLFLTVVYASLFILGYIGAIDAREGTIAAVFILLCTNLTAFTAFAPNIRSVRRNPATEHWLAWSIWSLAYTVLLITTFMSEGLAFSSILFYVYPAVNMILHGLIAWYAAKDEVPFLMHKTESGTVA